MSEEMPTVVWHSTDSNVYHTDSECSHLGETAEPKETSVFPVGHLTECRVCSGEADICPPPAAVGGGKSKLERILDEWEGDLPEAIRTPHDHDG